MEQNSKHGQSDNQEIFEISRKIRGDNALSGISGFSEEMTISQVVRFFARRDIEFTKTMIQNYVRIGLLPPPVDKRYYTVQHLILLNLIHSLKSVYPLEDIKVLFRPILKDLSTFDDDVMDISAIYEIYVKLYREALEDWETGLPRLIFQLQNMVDGSSVVQADKPVVFRFITILTLMAQSIASKRLANELIAQWFEDGKNPQ